MNTNQDFNAERKKKSLVISAVMRQTAVSDFQLIVFGAFSSRLESKKMFEPAAECQVCSSKMVHTNLRHD